MSTHLIAIVILAAIAAAWVGVQVAWKRAFSDAHSDPDALAGRMGCGGGCKSDSTSCSSKLTCESRDREERS